MEIIYQFTGRGLRLEKKKVSNALCTRSSLETTQLRNSLEVECEYIFKLLGK